MLLVGWMFGSSQRADLMVAAQHRPLDTYLVDAHVPEDHGA
jgi:hypothetical protein